MTAAGQSGAGNLELSNAEAAARAGRALIEPALERARTATSDGKAIDEHQVLTERVAYAATEVRAASEALALVKALRADGRSSELLELTAGAAIAELVNAARGRLEPVVDELGLGDAALEAAFPAAVRASLRALASEARLRRIGAYAIEVSGRTEPPLDETLEQVRATVREFATQEIAPHAERIHRRDELVPERFITKMGELGYFGLSIPEQYGGHELGNLAMILTTEELSRASLAAAGSLITRPEILAKALLAGGTEEQKQHWLPKLASGEVMVGDLGDRAQHRQRRRGREVPGDARQRGRERRLADHRREGVVHVRRARRRDRAARAHRSRFGQGGARPLAVHRRQAALLGPRLRDEAARRRTLTGKADRTPGYRGMHSFTLELR